MSTELDEMREKIKEILKYYRWGIEEANQEIFDRLISVNAMLQIKEHKEKEAIDQILSLETATCRLAVVRKKADIIEIFDRLGIKHYDEYIGFADLHGDDMLKAGFAQEVKDVQRDTA